MFDLVPPPPRFKNDFVAESLKLFFHSQGLSGRFQSASAGDEADRPIEFGRTGWSTAENNERDFAKFPPNFTRVAAFCVPGEKF